MTGNGKPQVKLGFERELITVALDNLVPTKMMRANFKQGKKYNQILTSIKSIGVIEAPAIYRDHVKEGMFLLLDGHLRVEALRDLGHSFVRCLISTDDEAFTYNKRLNRINAAQEHRMVVKALERGASAERIAESLGLDTSTIRRRSKMMNGICPEATELLRDAPCPMKVFDILRQMKPLRQITAVELMVGQNNFSVALASTVLSTSKPEELVSKKKKSVNGAEHLARLERELLSLQTQVKAVEESYGVDNLQLTLAQAYLKKILLNGRIVRWLAQHRAEYLEQFQAIAEVNALPS